LFVFILLLWLDPFEVDRFILKSCTELRRSA